MPIRCVVYAPPEPPITPFPGAGQSGQPTAEERELESDEDDQSPPPPPPKDGDEEVAEPSVNGHAEQNGDKPSDTEVPAEKVEEDGNDNAEAVDKPDEKEEDSSSSESKNGKGKEGEGDFNEVPL